MIGDTWFDTKGARLCGVDFVGVEYGYGDLESMKKRGRQGVCKNNGRTLGCSYKVNNLKSDKRNYPKIFRIHFIRE